MFDVIHFQITWKWIVIPLKKNTNIRYDLIVFIVRFIFTWPLIILFTGCTLYTCNVYCNNQLKNSLRTRSVINNQWITKEVKWFNRMHEHRCCFQILDFETRLTCFIEYQFSGRVIRTRFDKKPDNYFNIWDLCNACGHKNTYLPLAYSETAVFEPKPLDLFVFVIISKTGYTLHQSIGR